MYWQYHGYSGSCDSVRQGQMIVAQAKREADDGDIDAWFFAGCPIGNGYKKWRREVLAKEGK